MNNEQNEWVTIAQAARRLGLSERHARRMSGKVDPSDRMKKDSGPLRVRLSALAAHRDEEAQSAPRSAVPGQISEDNSARGPRDADTIRETTIADAVSRARAEERLQAAEAMIEELRADKHQLLQALEREQENQKRILDQLADERRELRLLQAQPTPNISNNLDTTARPAAPFETFHRLAATTDSNAHEPNVVSSDSDVIAKDEKEEAETRSEEQESDLAAENPDSRPFLSPMVGAKVLNESAARTPGLWKRIIQWIAD